MTATILAAAILWLSIPSGIQQQPAPQIRAVAAVDAVDACQAYPDSVRVEMRIHVRLENVGIEPLIVPRRWIQAGWRDAPNVDQLQSTGWGSFDFFSTDRSERPHIGNKPPSQFQILKVGGTMSVPMKVIVILLRPAMTFTVALQLRSVGDVFDGWTDEDRQSAERRWAGYGRLWFKAIDTEPFTVTVDSEGKRKNCS